MLLLQACCAGSLEVAEALLLVGGADPLVPVYAECRWTALQMAQREGHHAIALLIQARRRRTTGQTNRQTPAAAAAEETPMAD